MTTSTITAEVSLPGDGANYTFNLGFEVAAKTELVVSVYDSLTGTDTALTVDVDYTVSDVGVETGASITYPLTGSAIPATSTLLIARRSSDLQGQTLRIQGGFDPDAIMAQMDRLTRRVQELQAELDRTIRVPKGASGGTFAKSELPNGSFFALSSSWQPSIAAMVSGSFAASTFGQDLLIAANAAAGRSLFGLGALSTENTVSVALGGTGASTPAGARTALGVGTRDVPSDDADAISESGFYHTNSSTTTLPTGIGQFGGLIHIERTGAGGRAWQQYAPAGAPEMRLFFRNRVSTGWTSWAEILHSGATSWRYPFGGDAGNTETGLQFTQDGFLGATRDSDQCARLNRKGSTGTIMTFQNDEVTVGTISIAASTTAYNTSSDRNLKENFRDFDSGVIIDETEVWQFDWKINGATAFGVIAQDAQKVFPQAIAEGTAPVDDKFIPWQADYSKYVPVLLHENKQMRKRIAALEKAIKTMTEDGVEL